MPRIRLSYLIVFVIVLVYAALTLSTYDDSARWDLSRAALRRPPPNRRVVELLRAIEVFSLVLVCLSLPHGLTVLHPLVRFLDRYVFEPPDGFARYRDSFFLFMGGILIMCYSLVLLGVYRGPEEFLRREYATQ